MISFLKPAPFKERVSEDKLNSTYTKHRIQVFLGVFVGYAAYYLVRKNWSLALPQIQEIYGVGKAELGLAASALSMAYGLSKFVMGSVSDRSNPRFFMPLGLILSCATMILLGSMTYIFGTEPIQVGTAAFTFFLLFAVALNGINGWVQGMGWPPSGRTMVHWFSVKERGRAVSVWNVSHNIGGALIAPIGVWGFAMLGNVSGFFWVPAAIAAFLAVFVAIILRDTPQSVGLPPIEEYKDDYPKDYNESWEKEFSTKEIFFKYVLNNKYLWAIAIANAFAYYVRYGIVDWVPSYLQEAKGYSIKTSGNAWFYYEMAAIPGTIICGLISDIWFKGRRAPAGILFMALTAVAVYIYKLNSHGPLWIDNAALIAAGFFIYGPIMLIGLHALDLVPKKAAGTAAGFTGFFGYVFGANFAGIGAGFAIDHWGYNGYFWIILLCCILTMFCMAFTWNHGAVSSKR